MTPPMRDYLRLIDINSSGPRTDVSPIFANHAALSALVDDLVQPFSSVQTELVAGIDALGFVLGAAIAVKLAVGFIPIRKGGKIPGAVDSLEFVDYTGLRKSLELRKGAIRSGAKVLVVDEWVETGAQIAAAVELVENGGGIVIGICAINIDDNERTRKLREKYVCHSLLPAGAA
jgi:adenine phosphoribosyltransferase